MYEVDCGSEMPTSDSVHAVQIVFLLLLSIVAVFTVVARRLRIPYPIVLVIGGLLISFLPHAPLIPLNPALVFLIFLPPLLYAAAWQTNWSDFRRNLLSIAIRHRNRFAIAAIVQTPWGEVRIWNVHLDTLINVQEHVEQLQPVTDGAACHGGPQLIGGDFNTNELYWLGNVLPLPWLPAHISPRERLAAR